MSKNGEEKREKNTQNHIVCRANISRHRILQSGAMYISLIFHTTMLCQVPSTFYPFNSGQRAESSGGGVRPLLPLARKHGGGISKHLLRTIAFLFYCHCQRAIAGVLARSRPPSHSHSTHYEQPYPQKTSGNNNNNHKKREEKCREICRVAGDFCRASSFSLFFEANESKERPTHWTH